MRRKVFRLFLFLILAAGFWGCGKKGPPVALDSTVPGAVSDLSAWAKQGGIYLAWSFPKRNLDGTLLQDLEGFRVLRQTRSLGPGTCPDCPAKFEPVADIEVKFPQGARVEGDRVWWVDGNPKSNEEYNYAVVAFNRFGTVGPESNLRRISWNHPPGVVEKVTVKAGDRTLEVSWDSPPRPKIGEILTDLAGFNVYRREEGGTFGFFPVHSQPVPRSPYQDGRLQNGKRYEYSVRALRDFRGTLIEGPDSEVGSGVPEKRTPPSIPTGLVGVMRNEGNKRGAELRWNANPEPDLGGYDLYRRADEEDALSKMNPRLIPEPYFFDSTADPRKAYFYRLRAVDDSPNRNQSDFSLEVEVKP